MEDSTLSFFNAERDLIDTEISLATLDLQQKQLLHETYLKILEVSL
jgi:hypothetical protein